MKTGELRTPYTFIDHRSVEWNCHRVGREILYLTLRGTGNRAEDVEECCSVAAQRMAARCGVPANDLRQRLLRECGQSIA